MNKRLEFLKPIVPVLEGILCGVAGFLIFVLLSSQFDVSIEWIARNATLGTAILGGSLLTLNMDIMKKRGV